MLKRALVLYAKIPKAGEVKTRLTQGDHALSSQEAADLYRALLSDSITKFIAHNNDYHFFICVKKERDLFSSLFPGKYELLDDKGDGDLGRSMFMTTKRLIMRGYLAVCIIGSDIPFLNHNMVLQAFQYIENGYQVVLGPDHSGGCYLIGSRAPYPIFEQIEWSQGKDYKIIIERLNENNIQHQVLPIEMDIDTVEDFHQISKEIHSNKSTLYDEIPQTVQFINMFHVKHI